MQRANCVVRLKGSLNNTVPKLGVTVPEILILRYIHGSDAVVDIRPTEVDKKVRPERELERLRNIYDGGSSFGSTPDEERKSIIETLFPGAVKRIPLTLEEVGVDSGQVAPEPAPVPDLPDAEQEPAEAEDADAEPAADEADEPAAEGK